MANITYPDMAPEYTPDELLLRRNQKDTVHYKYYAKIGIKVLSTGRIGFRLSPLKNELELALQQHQSTRFVYIENRAVDASELQQRVTSVECTDEQIIVHVEYTMISKQSKPPEQEFVWA